MTYYTGIGSRKTPDKVLNLMSDIAYIYYIFLGSTLRSGGADGADKAFEAGCDKAHKNNGVNSLKEIYLPWKGFNNREGIIASDLPNWMEATDIMCSIHPKTQALTQGAWKLHTRNIYQILGKDLNIPSHQVICWTPNCEAIGGTRTALVLADRYEIPIYNLANPIVFNGFTDFVKKMKEKNGQHS